MNSMFDRLGEYLKDYINDDEQGIFSSPEEEKHNENTNNFYQENKSQSEENVDTKTSNKEFKFDTSKQQSEYNKTENKQKHTCCRRFWCW